MTWPIVIIDIVATYMMTLCLLGVEHAFAKSTLCLVMNASTKYHLQNSALCSCGDFCCHNNVCGSTLCIVN